MEADADSLPRAKRMTLYKVALALVAVLVAVLVEPAAPTIRYAAALVGIWLLFASLIRYAALRRQLPMPAFRRPIPIRFSGSLGRFTLRIRDRRRVEVRVGAEVVAEAVATPERDELVVDLEAVDDAELDAFGAALGAAMELVAVANENPSADRRGAPVHGAGDARPGATTGGVLRTIGSRPH